MKSRAANDQFQKDLEKTREKELKRKQAAVRKRMQAKLPGLTPSHMGNSTSVVQSPKSSTMKLINPQMNISDGQSLPIKPPLAGSAVGSNEEGGASNADLARGA